MNIYCFLRFHIYLLLFLHAERFTSYVVKLRLTLLDAEVWPFLEKTVEDTFV
jgi:hypothetical protein